MTTYPQAVEKRMKLFYESLSEKDRRRYAAVEAVKLGHGGVQYIASVLGCCADTIRQGQEDVSHLPDDEAADRVRKKGGSQVLS
jgi:hypothetical protein